MEDRDEPLLCAFAPFGIAVTFAGLMAASELPPYLGIPLAFIEVPCGLYLATGPVYRGLGLNKEDVRKALKRSVKSNLRKVRNSLVTKAITISSYNIF